RLSSLGCTPRRTSPLSLHDALPISVGSIIPRERRRQVQWRVAFVFGAAGIPATFAGTAVGHFLPQRWLLLAFAALMVVVAIRMLDRKSTRLNSSHVSISYAVFCLKK